MNEDNTQVAANAGQAASQVENQPTTPVAPTQSQPTESVTPTQSTPASTPSQIPTSQDQATLLKEQIAKDVSGKIRDEVSKSVISRIGEALGLTKKEEEALPTKPADLQKIIEERVEEKFKRWSKEAEEAQRATEQQRQERVNTIVSGWYSQYEQLARLGKVPKVTNQNDPNDQGAQARRRIIVTIGKMIEQNKMQGIDYTPTVSDVLLAYPNVLSGPAGADLPISGSSPAVSNTPQFTHKEIRHKSFEQLAKEGSF